MSAWAGVLLGFALPVGSLGLGFFLGWLLRREDALQERAELKRVTADQERLFAASNELCNRNETLIAAVETYRRDWQALRAIVEQHTVQEKV